MVLVVVVVVVVTTVLTVVTIELNTGALIALLLEFGQCYSDCFPSTETLIQIAKSQDYEHSSFYSEMFLGDPQKAF